MQTINSLLGWVRENRWWVIGLAFVLAAAGTIGSLYFSQIKGLIPCELCWFQRIFMFPVPIILAMAGYRQDKKGYLYALSLALVGLVIALYHLSIQGDTLAGSTCGGGESCTDEPFFWFSWLSIPLGSALTFFGIAGLLSLVAISDYSDKLGLKTTTKTKK